MCEVILVEFDVLAKKHSSKFGVKTCKNRICTRHFEGYQKSVAPINSWDSPGFCQSFYLSDKCLNVMMFQTTVGHFGQALVLKSNLSK